MFIEFDKDYLREFTSKDAQAIRSTATSLK